MCPEPHHLAMSDAGRFLESSATCSSNLWSFRKAASWHWFLADGSVLCSTPPNHKTVGVGQGFAGGRCKHPPNTATKLEESSAPRLLQLPTASRPDRQCPVEWDLHCLSPCCNARDLLCSGSECIPADHCLALWAQRPTCER